MNKKKALEKHNLWLQSMGISTSKPKRRRTGIHSIPDYTVKENVALSNSVGNGYAKRSNTYSGSGTLCVGQAYNKGNYVVLSKEEASDPTTGKRR